MPQPDHASREQIVCDSVTSGCERVVRVMHARYTGGLGRMWGPGPWTMGPMGAFWWIVPAMVRMMIGGGRFMCMGSHHEYGEEMARLRREVDDLREQMKKHCAAR
jgi:hypothetical protein